MTPHRDDILRALIERLDGPVFVLDSDYCYREFNDQHRAAMATLYGTVPEVGRCLLDLIPDPASRSLVETNLSRALAGHTVTEQTPYDEAAPPPAVYQVFHVPVTDHDGAITGILVTARNITEEVQAKRLLSISEHSLQEALDASEIASWSYNGNTGEAFYSDRYCTMLGYPAGSFPPTLEGWISQLHPDDLDATLGSFRYYIQTKTESFQLEFRMRTRTGGWKWILGQAKVVERDARGLPVRVAGTNQDITARRLAENALRESEARWTSLVDMAPVGISLIGRGGVVQFANRMAVPFLDSSAIGRPWAEFFPQELHPELNRVLEAGFERGESLTFRTWVPCETRGLTHYENFVSPILEDGGVSALMVISVDVTAAELMAHRRKKASQRMGILLSLHNESGWDQQRLFDEALNAAVELTDSQIGYVYFYCEETELFTLHSWSRGVMDACQVMDPQTTYALGRTGFWGEVVRQRRPILVNDFQRPTEFHRGMPEGHVPLNRFLSIPVMEGGRIVAVIGVANKRLPYDNDDVDELNFLSESLWQLLRRRESEETMNRLHQAVEHAPVSIVITDRDGDITYVNPRFVSLTGYTSAEVLGKNPRLLNSRQGDPQVFRDLWSTILAGRDWQGEFINRKKEGTLFTELASISPVSGPGGAITHFIAVKEDITERKATQELLQQTQKMETVGQLAAGVAHDFNNLLTSMLSYNQMLLLKLEPGNSLRTYAEKLELSGQRAASLVSGLLAVGRRQRMEPAPVDLRSLLAEEVVLLESLVKGRAVLEWQPGPEALEVEVDSSQIGQVVVNLVANAKDALGPGGTISLSCGSRTDDQGRWAWFRVQDNGPGIPEAIRHKVFDPFFTTKAFGKGTGLGLSIVQGIILQHQGTIRLEPAPFGASFLVSLPLVLPPT